MRSRTRRHDGRRPDDRHALLGQQHRPAQGPLPRRRHGRSWTTTTITGTITGPTPGSGATGTGCGKGPVINEFSDALGTNNYVYEFVEIYNDK